MGPFCPLFDASIAGAIAQVTLARFAASPIPVETSFRPSPAPAQISAPMRSRGWLGAVFDLVSGPAPVHPRSGANNF
jgi:hypothetical protein